jgi:hypothetical protein
MNWDWFKRLVHSFERAANNEAIAPDQRFSALDGLLFADMKKGDVPSAMEHLALMTRLVEEHVLDVSDRLTLAIKKMNLAVLKGDAHEVGREIAQVSALVPKNPEHQRIFRYNAAHAFFSLGRYTACVSETSKLIPEYYEEANNPQQSWGFEGEPP